MPSLVRLLVPVVVLLAIVSPRPLAQSTQSPQSPQPTEAAPPTEAAQPIESARPTQPLAVPDYAAPPVQRLTAKTVRAYDAPEATQGATADREFFYAIDNTVLGKYEIASGRFVNRWIGPRRGLVRHMNSCYVDAGRIRCANSNYSLTPMGSSVEVFDTKTMTHAATHSLGMTDEGSLTWFGPYNGGWIAGFAHYDESGSVGFKNHRFSSVVTYDSEWRRTGGWLFPASVLERMAPFASSGGAIGPDGWLYLLGHDRPEMYVVARPSMGPTLIHLATIDLEAEGQAFGWAQDGTRRIFAIDRKGRRVLAIDIPPVNAADVRDALPFRDAQVKSSKRK